MKTLRLSFLLLASSIGLQAQNQSKVSFKDQDSLSTITLEEVKLTGIKAKDNTTSHLYKCFKKGYCLQKFRTRHSDFIKLFTCSSNDK